MIVYSRDGGYGKVDLKAVEEAIMALPLGTPGRQLLLELAYDYECMMRVIDGKGCIFRHDEDGSETRRLRLYR